MHIDIFCKVVDNYGDIGFSLRLIKHLLTSTLVNKIRFFCDDIELFHVLSTDALHEDITLGRFDKYAIQHWSHISGDKFDQLLILEIFDCGIPSDYFKRFIESTNIVHINIEYLSAEKWVDDFHQKCSIDPVTLKKRYFFFPGFTKNTGGVLLNKNIINQEFKFPYLNIARNDYLFISLFLYEKNNIKFLFLSLKSINKKVVIFITKCSIANLVKKYLNLQEFNYYQAYNDDNLIFVFLPFLDQDTYQALLMQCDVNFVRGEDSFIASQLVNKPFIWQIYKQENSVHLIKLEAFLQCFLAKTNSERFKIFARFCMCWNQACSDTELYDTSLSFFENIDTLQKDFYLWTSYLNSLNDFSDNLLLFAKNLLK